MWGERRQWRGHGGPGVLCERGEVGAAVSPPGPSAGGDSGLWRLEEPRPRSLRTSQSCTLGGGTGGWGVALGFCQGCSEARDHGKGRARAWGLPGSTSWSQAELELLYTRAPPISGVAVGYQRCSHLSLCPVSMAWLWETFCYGGASSRLSNSRNAPSNKCSPFAGRAGTPRWGPPHSPPISRAGNPDLTSSARTIPTYNPNNLGCSGTPAVPGAVGMNRWGQSTSLRTHRARGYLGRAGRAEVMPNTPTPTAHCWEEPGTLWRQQPGCWQPGVSVG